MLAHADKEGWVDIHPRAIAEEVGLTVEQVNAAIAELEAPDAESRSPEESGRRIVRLDEHRAWGWRVVNHAKYRAIRSEEDRREQNRLAQRRFRESRKQPVSDSKQSKPPSAYTEADTYTETSKRKTYDAQAHLLSIGVDGGFIKDWFAIRKAKKLPATETAIKEILREIEKSGLSPSDAIKECCARGWAGFKASWITGDGKNGSSRADRLNNVIAELTGANRHHSPVIDGVAERVD